MSMRTVAPDVMRSERGFSLAEMSVALAITSLLFLAALSMLAMDQKVYNRDDAVLEAAREGRYISEMLERDLLMAGYQVDVRTIADDGPDGTSNTDDDIVGQPQIVYAAPYELVFNADIDPNVNAIQDGLAGDSVPTGYAPVTFHTGAETIRYTLDSTGDGTIANTDRGDEADEAVTDNTGLFLLRREVYGYNGTNNRNPSGPVGLMRGPIAYPNGSRAIPLFLYWGDFDTDPAKDLWGDNGAGGGTAGNGILEPGEIAALSAVTDEDTDNDSTLDTGEDRNGNGTLERRVTSLISRIEVHVTTETSYPDIDYVDPNRSSNTTPFKYRSVMSNTEIKPRNIDLPGGACGDEPEPTKSPSIVNACPNALADGKVRVGWSLSDDDGNYEDDIEKYVVWRTDVNSIFGPTPYDEVLGGSGTWDDDFIEMRTWPPRQYWYRVRAMDCTPQLSRLDPTAGPYPAAPGPSYPPNFDVLDVPGDDGTNLDVTWVNSPDDPSNTTGYGADVDDYHVYRSTSSDYRCQAPVNKTAIAASGASDYTFTDNATNSSSALVYGELYYYWLRAVDSASGISPYSPRGCARPYKGPTFPIGQAARVVNYGSTDHPPEVWFSPNPANEAAGYDPYLLEYRVYRGTDLDSDGNSDSLVDYVNGYRASDLVDTLHWDGIFWTVGSGGTADIYHAIDASTGARDLSHGSTETLNDVAFSNRLEGVIVGTSGATLTTNNGGATWNELTAVTSAELKGVASAAGGDVFVAGGTSGTLIRSDNAGGSWALVASPLSDTIQDIDGEELFFAAVGDNGAVAISIDGGQTFAQSATFTAVDNLEDVCVAPGSFAATSGYIVGGEKVWTSHDSGSTWTEQTLAGEGDFSSVDCVDANNAVIASEDQDKLLVTADGGASWSQPAVSPPSPLDVKMLSPRLIYTVTANGSVYFRDHAGSWQSQALEAGVALTGLALRGEMVFEDSTKSADASGTSYYYVVTARYAQSTSLDGESGLTPDRPNTIEIPDDSDDQILVDSCKNIELAAMQP